jgi:hypothetical protein
MMVGVIPQLHSPWRTEAAASADRTDLALCAVAANCKYTPDINTAAQSSLNSIEHRLHEVAPWSIIQWLTMSVIYVATAE